VADRKRVAWRAGLTDSSSVFESVAIFVGATHESVQCCHRCDFCGQEIAYLLPDSPEDAFGTLFQERTFLELRSAQIRDPSRQVAEYWYCSDYCAREDLDVRINQREEKMRQYCEINQLSFCFFGGLIQTGTATEL
jgi:hypothetical protein